MKNVGLIFEAVLAKSWAASNIKLVRMKITETGEARPCDERIDFEDYRVFNELKSTDKDYFSVTMLGNHQIRSLWQWEQKFKNSISLVTIEFRKYNTAYMIDYKTLRSHFINKNRIKQDEILKKRHYKMTLNDGIYTIKEDILEYFKDIKKEA